MSKPLQVRSSPVHGTGLFATERLRKGTRLIEYQGRRVEWHEVTEKEDGHTFTMALDDGRVIDGGVGGSRARFINHSCDPNCETYDVEGRIFVYSRRAIAAEEELTIDYALVIDEPVTASVRRRYACRCGEPNCRRTMLDTSAAT